jgi:peroxiredoxin
MIISRQYLHGSVSYFSAFIAVALLLNCITPVPALAEDDVYPAAKIDKPVITALKIKPNKLEANEKNDFIFILKFSDKKANLQGGTLLISVTESNGFTHDLEFELKHKKFARIKGRFKFKESLVLGDCNEIKIKARLRDSSKLKSKAKKMTMAVNGSSDNGGGGGGGGGGDAEWGVKIGNKAVNFTLQDQNGNQVNLHDYMGKVILLDLSTMWCGPCKSEAAHAEELYQKYKDQGFVMLTVLFQDYSGNSITTEDCKTWCDTYSLTIPVLADTDSSVWNLYDELGYIPLNLVIDRDMIIRYKDVGFNPTVVEQTIQSLLGS